MKQIDLLISRYPALVACREEMEKAVSAIVTMHSKKGKLLLCGNGGSAADCGHIAGELMKGFLSLRPLCEEQRGNLTKAGLTSDDVTKLQQGICALSLPEMSAPLSAFANDVDPDLVYAQLVLATGRPGDVFLGISTSGNSKNIVLAAKVAKASGLVTLGLTGKSGGKLAQICDTAICVPATETYQVQELHLPVYHAVCAEAEEELFGSF